MDLTESKKEKQLVSAAEQAQVERSLMAWINKSPELGGLSLDFQVLAEDAPGIAVFSNDSAYYSKFYICGGHQGEYQYVIVRRIIPDNSQNDRLEAVELLNRLGDWLMNNPPDLGENISFAANRPMSRGHFAGVGENGVEDYEIAMKLTYEVI